MGIFGEFDIDEDYMVKTKEVLGLFVAQKEEEKKEATPPPVEEAPPPEEDEGESKKEEEEEEGRQVNFFSDHLHPISYFFYLQNGDQLSATPHSGTRGEQLIVSCSRWRQLCGGHKPASPRSSHSSFWPAQMYGPDSIL